MSRVRKRTGTYPLRPPSSLKAAVREVSRKDGTSINQFVTTAVAEKLSAMRTADFFAERGAEADIEAARREADRQPAGQDRGPWRHHDDGGSLGTLMISLDTHVLVHALEGKLNAAELELLDRNQWSVSGGIRKRGGPRTPARVQPRRRPAPSVRGAGLIHQPGFHFPLSAGNSAT